MENKAEAIGTIVGSVLVIAVAFLLAWIFDINPLKEYGWLMGCFHGAWLIPNWIMSLFNDAVLTKALLHTSAYNVFYWIFLVINVWVWIRMIFTTLAAVLKLFK